MFVIASDRRGGLELASLLSGPVQDLGHQYGCIFVASPNARLPFSQVSGTCDTRETVLKRDGTNVVTDSACKSTSGNWVSPYDGVATTLASDLDIVSGCSELRYDPIADVTSIRIMSFR